TAQDAIFDTAATYGGTVHFTSTDTRGTLPADYTFTAADHGVHTFSATFLAAAPQTLSVADAATAVVTGTQTGIGVGPAAAASIRQGGLPTSSTAGAARTVTITAFDSYGNVATGYTGTAPFVST